MVATVRCAPPDNRPSIDERDTCAPWLLREVALVEEHVRAVVCLGSYGWDAALRTFRQMGYTVPRPKPRFGHAAEAYGALATRLTPRSFMYEDALIDQARSLELAGKKDDAIAAYRRVLKDVPTARRADDVRSRLASLGASPH